MRLILRFFAYFVSVIFHPLLMMTYMLVILLLVNPYLFGGATLSNGGLLVVKIFLYTVPIPVIAVLMMRALEMVSSLELKESQDRIGPYIITGILYLWVFRSLLDNPDIPEAFKIFTLGATIALFVAFFINLFSKISMHSTGMGGLLGMVILTMTEYSFQSFSLAFAGQGYQVSMGSFFIFTLIACGVVGSARLLLGAHQPRDLYGGFVVGLVSQALAYFILAA